MVATDPWPNFFAVDNRLSPPSSTPCPGHLRPIPLRPPRSRNRRSDGAVLRGAKPSVAANLLEFTFTTEFWSFPFRATPSAEVPTFALFDPFPPNYTPTPKKIKRLFLWLPSPEDRSLLDLISGPLRGNPDQKCSMPI